MAQFVTVQRSNTIGKCWSPDLYLKQCYKCNKYNTCKLNCKVINKEYDKFKQRGRVLAYLKRRYDREYRKIHVKIPYFFM